MAVVSLLAAPGDVGLPGVPFDELGAFAEWLVSVPPVGRWVSDHQGAGLTVTVCGQGTHLPEGRPLLDVPLTDSEYARFEQVSAEAADRRSHG